MIRKNKRYYLILLWNVSLCATVIAQSEQTAATKIITAQYSFENENDTDGWEAKNGKLSLSGDHYKDGQHSLEWNWQEGSILEISSLKGLKEAGSIYPGGIPEIYEPAFYPRNRFGGIKMWLYQEKPSSGQMVFQIGSSLSTVYKTPKYRFSVNLDFTGWRAVWVCFEEDAKVKEYTGSDDMQAVIAFPKNTKENGNKLFIDHFTLLSFVSNKRNADLQFVNNKRNLRSADGYEILKPFQAFTSSVFNQKTDAAALQQDCNEITKRLEFLILGDKTNDWKIRNTGIEKEMQEKLKAALSLYGKLGLKNNNGRIGGVPLFAIRDEHPAAEGLVFDNVAQSVMFPLAVDYRLNGNTSSEEKLTQTLDYFLDQGWAAGSALGTVDHVIRLTPVATAVFLLRQELGKKNKLKPLVDMLIWHTRMGSMLNIDHSRGENSDKVRGGALVKLITILLMDNDARKQQLLQSFKEYMDYVIAVAPGYSDTFKPDFSIYHHRGTYLNVYGTNALNTMALIHWLLQDTRYAMSAQSVSNLKQALVCQADIAFGTQIHYGVSGRFPLNNSSIDGNSMPAFAYMCMAKDTVNDKNLASLFSYIYTIAAPDEVNKMLLPALTYSGTYGTLDLMVRAYTQTKGAGVPADGATVMPYSGLLAYRHEGAFATVKGYNKYVWDYEGGKGENNLGRYLSHGMLITAQGNEKSGFDSLGMGMNEGFDWSMLPGATTKMLPAEKMLYFIKADKKYIEGKHRNFSESLMASGLKQRGNGMFAFDLRDDVFPDEDKTLFDNSFRAKKSYFFVDNEIICLGSGINNNDNRYNTVTTLFQYHFNERKPNYLNGKIISHSLPTQADGGYFTDQNGFQYIFPKTERIEIKHAIQHSCKLVKGKYQKVSADYVKAYIDHGRQPKEGRYEYEVLMNTKPENVATYIHNKSYVVMRKDNIAHIVYHKTSGITAYAVYKAGVPLNNIILNVSTPLLAMIKKDSGRMLLTIANPDIGQAKWNHNMSHMPDSITNAWARGSIVTLTVKGAWYMAKYSDKLLNTIVNNGNTTISIFCKDGESIDLPLQHREGSVDAEE